MHQAQVTYTGREYLEWIVGDMLEAFLVEVVLREDHWLTQRRVGLREARKDPYTSSALFTRKEDDKRCAFCLGTHTPEDRKKVMNTAECKKLLLKFGRCFNCINKGHCTQDCKAVIKCKNCKGSQNTCLCDTKSQQPSGGVSDQPSTVNAQSSLLVDTESRINL